MIDLTEGENGEKVKIIVQESFRIILKKKGKTKCKNKL